MLRFPNRNQKIYILGRLAYLFYFWGEESQQHIHKQYASVYLSEKVIDHPWTL